MNVVIAFQVKPAPIPNATTGCLTHNQCPATPIFSVEHVTDGQKWTSSHSSFLPLASPPQLFPPLCRTEDYFTGVSAIIISVVQQNSVGESLSVSGQLLKLHSFFLHSTDTPTCVSVTVSKVTSHCRVRFRPA